jgi:hypothetical protein
MVADLISALNGKPQGNVDVAGSTPAAADNATPAGRR